MSKFADIQIDPSIVKRAARGDVRAHEIIYRAFATPVYSLCLRFTRVPAHAEDLVQETFIEIMRSIAKFRGEAALGSWIRRIAVSKALMFLRSAWTARGQALGDDLTGDPAVWEESLSGHGGGLISCVKMASFGYENASLQGVTILRERKLYETKGQKETKSHRCAPTLQDQR